MPWSRPGWPEGFGVLSHRGRTAGPGDQAPHVGAGSARPRDNTLAAFAAALAAGADGVELDVRRSADGVAVVHHDAVVPDAGPLHLLRRSDLPAWVPTLEEALAVCAGAAVDVEVKSSPAEAGHDPAERLAAEVAELVEQCTGTGRGPALAMVSCFWPAPLEVVRAVRPGLATGLLGFPAGEAGDAVGQAEALGARVLLPFGPHVTAGLVHKAHQSGLAVVPWAVDESTELRAVAGAGADAVVTDHVRRALACVGRI